MVDIIDEPIKIDNPQNSSVDLDEVKVVLLLDETGSMLRAAADTINNLNGYLDEQATRDKKVLVSVYTFNSNTGVRERFRNVDAREAPRLGLLSRGLDSKLVYDPSGTTPLYDAIGRVIGKETDDVPTLLVILTDGAENASREFNHNQITDLIKKQEDEGWTFAFLMADISRHVALDVASSLMGREYEGGTMSYSKGAEDMAFRGLTASSASWEDSARTMRKAGIKSMARATSKNFFDEGTRDVKKQEQVEKKAEVKKD